MSEHDGLTVMMTVFFFGNALLTIVGVGAILEAIDKIKANPSVKDGGK